MLLNYCIHVTYYKLQNLCQCQYPVDKLFLQLKIRRSATHFLGHNKELSLKIRVPFSFLCFIFVAPALTIFPAP